MPKLSTDSYNSPEWNPRKINEQQKHKLAKSLAEFGDLSGIVVNKTTGNYIGGNQRIDQLGSCPIIVTKIFKKGESPTGTSREGYIESTSGERFSWREVVWDEAREKAANIAANAHGGDWDWAKLVEPCIEVREAGIDLDLLGIDDRVLQGLLYIEPDSDTGNGNGSASGDGVESTREVPEGSVYRMSRSSDNYLICGDSTEQWVYDALIELSGVSEIEMVMTSPPYDNQRTYDQNEELDWTDLMTKVFSLIPYSPKCQAIVNLGLYYNKLQWVSYWDEWLTWMSDHKWLHAGWYIWDQGSGLPGDWKGRLAPSFEFLFHLSRGRVDLNKIHPKAVKTSAGEKFGIRKKDGKVASNAKAAKDYDQSYRVSDSVVRVPRARTAGIPGDHPAAYPPELAMRMIATFSKEGHSVIDPFCGSGSTLIASDATNRIGLGIEKNPKYVASTLDRLELLGFEVERLT